MKDKILMLIIGILIGAIITAGCFVLFGRNNNQGMDKINGRNFDANTVNSERRERPGRDGNDIEVPSAAPENSEDNTIADA